MNDSERRIVAGAEEKIKARRLRTAAPVPRVAGVPGQKDVAGRVGGRSVLGRERWLVDEGAFSSDFYAYMRVRVPAISNGISIWKDLAMHGAELEYQNGTERQQAKAQEIVGDLDKRAYEFNFCGGLCLDSLMEQFYTSLFTFGRFAAEMVPFADMSGVAYVGQIDPFSVKFKRDKFGVSMYQRTEDDRMIPLPPERVFYAPFDADMLHPQGVSVLDSVAWVVEIKERMLADMAKASHNAGFPRYAVELARPEPLQGESTADYTARARTEFDGLVKDFRDLAPDDNVFVWAGTTVRVIGFGSTDFNFSINYGLVEALVAAGLRLPLWALAARTAEAKNWVEAQFALLMQRVGRAAILGSRYMEWILNTELALRGSVVRIKQKFTPIGDPGRLVHERAQNFLWTRVEAMVRLGYITKDVGARIMGFNSAAEQEIVRAVSDKQKAA